jgi:hypothetical protein
MCPCDHFVAVLPCGPLLRILAHCLPHTRLIEFRMSLLAFGELGIPQPAQLL